VQRGRGARKPAAHRGREVDAVGRAIRQHKLQCRAAVQSEAPEKPADVGNSERRNAMEDNATAHEVLIADPILTTVQRSALTAAGACGGVDAPGGDDVVNLSWNCAKCALPWKLRFAANRNVCQRMTQLVQQSWMRPGSLPPPTRQDPLSQPRGPVVQAIPRTGRRAASRM
jgi:hypothetical protein